MSDEVAENRRNVAYGTFRIPVMPPRTRVSVDIGIPHEGRNYPSFPYLYSCLDCKFSTQDVDEMLKHQKNQGLLHRLFGHLGL